MMQRSGSANLPLHGGRVPAWLSLRMAALGRVIVEAIIEHYDRQELLRRLADPFWFQSFGAVMGMDWHSSGITTSVISALKRGLAPVQAELGVFVCGGRGAQSRRTPAELSSMGERTGLDAGPLIRTSRLVAKIDSAVVQDGYDLYLHGFFATVDGDWCVVQQGMNPGQREARRYHWQSQGMAGYFDSSHTAIEGRNVGLIVNLADRQAEASRAASVDLVRRGPDPLIAILRQFGERRPRNLDLFVTDEPILNADAVFPANIEESLQFTGESHLKLPPHHAVREADVDMKRLHATLAAAADRGPVDFADLLLTPGVGARTVASLAFVAEVIHGAPYRFHDPGRFAFAHGGKDGHPFPVPLKVYDETISVLKRALGSAKIGRRDALDAIKRLDDQARLIDNVANGPSLANYIAAERAHSPRYGGRRT